MQIYFLQEEFILKRNHTNARYAGRHFLAKEEHKDSAVSVKRNYFERNPINARIAHNPHRIP